MTTLDEYRAIKRAMGALDKVPRTPARDAAFNELHDTYWDVCPAPANKPQRREPVA